MFIDLEQKEIADIYSTPIFQQTSFWCNVKHKLGIQSDAFEFKVRNSDLYSNVGGYAYTNADFIVLYQRLNADECIAYIPYGPEIEPSEENQGNFLEELSEMSAFVLTKILHRHTLRLKLGVALVQGVRL